MQSLEEKTGFFLCKDYAGKGPRVVLLCGRRWTSALLKHYGIGGEPFFVRARRDTEPEVMANGHPWGWAYKLDEVIKDEARWLATADLNDFKTALIRAVKAQEERDKEMLSVNLVKEVEC